MAEVKRVVPPIQSSEVVGQRVKDLEAYLRGNLPELFEGDSATIKLSDLLLVLQELDIEFAEPVHTVSTFTFMATCIEGVMDPVTEAVGEAQRQAMIQDDPEFEQFRGVLEVDWLSIVPTFTGDIEQLRNIAGRTASAILNGTMWENPVWSTFGYEMLEEFKDLVDLFIGMVGFIILFSYIQITKEQNYPKVNFHLRDVE